MSEVWLVRPAEARDLPHVVALSDAATRACGLVLPENADALAAAVGADMATSEPALVVACSPAGEVVGWQMRGHFTERTRERFATHRGYVSPHVRRRGVGSALLADAHRAVERRGSADLAGLSAWHYEREAGARALMRKSGYRPVRSMRQLHVLLPLPTPPLRRPPAGLELQPFQPERTEAVWRAFVQTSGDDLSPPFVDDSMACAWIEQAMWRLDFWQVAWSGTKVVGLALPRLARGGVAYLEHLGVRRDWRRRGVGTWLVAWSAAAVSAAGATRLVLDVNQGNTTGAEHLYEQLGFRQLDTIAVWRRALG